MAAELRVLVRERVEAVRALRDDLLHAVAVQSVDVLLRERLEEVLVSEPPRRVAVAGLLFAEDHEVDLGGLQDLHQGTRDLLLALVEAAGAADEEQPLEILRRFLEARCGAHSQVGAPLRAPVRSHSPGVSLALHPLEHARRFFRKPRFHQHEVPSHVDDARQVLDEHRARLLAPAAGRARPHRFVGQHAVFAHERRQLLDHLRRKLQPAGKRSFGARRGVGPGRPAQDLRVQETIR